MGYKSPTGRRKKPSAARQRAQSSRSKRQDRVNADTEQSLTERAYNALEEKIVTLQLRPGETVSEAGLAEQLGIGRTPIREALQRLARESLVRILPRRGIIVSEIDVKAQLRLLETRRMLEALIVGAAAKRATVEERQQFSNMADIFQRTVSSKNEIEFMRCDRAFNDLCLRCARNEFAANAMGLINALSRRFWYVHYKQAADLPLTARLHANIARAIAEGNEQAAVTADRALMDLIESFTMATLSPDIGNKL